MPVSRIRLETAKESDLVRDALRAAIDEETDFPTWWLALWTGRHVVGTVANPRFRLVSRSRWRDFYLPVTEGSITRHGDITVLEAALRPKRTDLAQLAGFFLLMSVVSLANKGSLWGVAMMAGIVHLAGCWGFMRARRRIEALLFTCV
jgi:hypothetical protein